MARNRPLRKKPLARRSIYPTDLGWDAAPPQHAAGWSRGRLWARWASRWRGLWRTQTISSMHIHWWLFAPI